MTNNLPSSTLIALDRKIQNVISTAADLYKELASDDWHASLNSRIEELIRLLEKCLTARENLGLEKEYEELDVQGVMIWNLLTNLTVEEMDDETRLQTVVNARILAFFMLSCSKQFSEWSQRNTVRLLKVALKAGRVCIECQHYTWALKIMEKAAKFREKLVIAAEGEEEPLYESLGREYFKLRMKLAWKQSNLSVAEFMYAKALPSGGDPDPQTSEEVAGILFEMGNDMLCKKAYDTAIKWLRRSYELLTAMDPLCYSEVASELRLGVMYSLAKACISDSSGGSLDMARNIVELMIEEWPMRTSAHLLKLDLVAAELPDAVKAYHEVLLKMISIVQITETVFKTIVGKIHKLAVKSELLACNCLDELVTTRLATLGQDEWIEQSFITRLWLTLKGSLDLDEVKLQTFVKLLDAMSQQLTRSLSPKGTHAAQILLWKISEALYIEEKFGQASQWCEAAFHQIFDKSGELNQAKIARRIIHCAIHIGDFGKALEVHRSMPESARQHPSTMFLMFKVALRTSDNALAESSIRSICESSVQDHRVLYACALDARTVGNQQETLRVLKYILREIDSLSPDCVNLPAAIRCTIRLSMEEITASEGSEIANTESLCRVLELAVEQAEKSRCTNNHLQRKRRNTDDHPRVIFTVKELEWFSRTTYNIGLTSIEKWHPSISLRILNTCIKFLQTYPDDIDGPTKTSIQLRFVFCHFLCASLYIELARGEDQDGTRLQQYLDAKSHIQHFRARKVSALERISDEDRWDVKEKFSTLLLYDFEASIHLGDWDSLSALVDEARGFGDTSTFQYLGDMILRSQAPDRVLMPVLKKILGNLISKEDSDTLKLAKCIRCQVQLSLVRDPKITEELLGQVIGIIRDSKRERKYPNEEILWLTTAAWNRAIEFKCGSDENKYQTFVEFALTLAKLYEDGGKLLARLQKKYLRDGWEQ